jgi:hypothetical protein
MNALGVNEHLVLEREEFPAPTQSARSAQSAQVFPSAKGEPFIRRLRGGR